MRSIFPCGMYLVTEGFGLVLADNSMAVTVDVRTAPVTKRGFYTAIRHGRNRLLAQADQRLTRPASVASTDGARDPVHMVRTNSVPPSQAPSSR